MPVLFTGTKAGIGRDEKIIHETQTPGQVLYLADHLKRSVKR